MRRRFRSRDGARMPGGSPFQGEPPGELSQPLLAGVGDGPVRHSAFSPVKHVEALALAGDWRASGAVRGVGGGPGEKVDDVAVGAIDQGRDRMISEIVEAAADEGKTLTGEVDDDRRVVELA